MKKTISLLVICLIIFLVGCKPSDVTDEYYDAGIRVLEIVDSYLDFKIDSDTAYERINSINENLDEAKDLTTDSNIKFWINSLAWDLNPMYIEYNTDVEISDARNTLAEYLGESKR